MIRAHVLLTRETPRYNITVNATKKKLIVRNRNNGRCILPEANNAIKMSLIPRDHVTFRKRNESTITFTIERIGRLSLAACSLVVYIYRDVLGCLMAPIKWHFTSESRITDARAGVLLKRPG